MSIVDVVAGNWRWLLANWGKPCVYTAGPLGDATLTVYVIGKKPEELVGAAGQFDVSATIDAAAFAAAYPTRPKPQRFDHLRTMGSSYSVEDANGRPNMDDPVFFLLRLRGGSL